MGWLPGWNNQQARNVACKRNLVPALLLPDLSPDRACTSQVRSQCNVGGKVTAYVQYRLTEGVCRECTCLAAA